MENAASDNTIWYILLVLGLIYLIILFRNKKATKRRRSRKFMEGKRKRGRDDEQWAITNEQWTVKKQMIIIDNCLLIIAYW